MCYFCFIKWIASLNYIIKAKNAPLIFKNNSKYISFLIHDSAFNYCPGPFLSFFPSLTVSLYADSINGAKLPKKFLPNVHNVKINEFVIGCCTKKNYFLISAQPSKNLPSSRNKIHTHRRKWTERQRSSKVTLRMKFSLLPASFQPSRKSVLEQTRQRGQAGIQPSRCPALCLHRDPDIQQEHHSPGPSWHPLCSFLGCETLSKLLDSSLPPPPHL